MKRILSLALVVLLAITMLTGCGGGNSSTTGEGSSSFDTSKTINVVSREEGSGTRGAFVELTGVEAEDESGEKVDNTLAAATITDSTSVMMTTVAGDPHAIGYISLGSLNETVKALKIDGVEATTDNVKSGDYTLSRPFNIATGAEVSEAAQDFINYIMSTEGQAVIGENGYVSIAEDTAAFESNGASGTVVVAGSSSVTPVMEKLAEAYQAINTNVKVQVQQSDSTTGMTSAIDGICDIGMASRELKDSELEAGLKATVIAMDGIAVIVNNECTLDELTTEQVKDIYTGAITVWSDLVK